MFVDECGQYPSSRGEEEARSHRDEEKASRGEAAKAQELQADQRLAHVDISGINYIDSIAKGKCSPYSLAFACTICAPWL